MSERDVERALIRGALAFILIALACFGLIGWAVWEAL